MEIFSSEDDSLQAYNLLFNRTHFGFVSGLNLENLKYFSVQNQERLGKIDIKFNINGIRKLQKSSKLHYILMTDYQQILSIPYLLRNQSNEVKILATKSMVHSAEIYGKDFYRKVKKMDQVVKQPTFQQQSIIYDNYEIEFNMNFGDWVGIFSKTQLDACLQKCIGLNYGQKYQTETGVEITAYPSGETIGSSAWLLQNIQTKQNILWIQKMSHHTWRACRQFHIDSIHHKINTMIFTEGTLDKIQDQNKDQTECQAFLDVLFQRLTKSLNSKIILNDVLLICDIINVIVYKFKEKFKKVLVTGISATKMITYANSYVQFLTQIHKNRIYEDPPVYPFQAFEDLKEKMLNEGTNIQQIAEHLKIPVKELLLRSTPYIHFQSDFHAFLEEGINANVQRIMQTCINTKKLNNWINNCNINKIHLFHLKKPNNEQVLTKIKTKVEKQINFVQIGSKLVHNTQNTGIYMTSEGQFGRYLSKFTKQSGWLNTQPLYRHFRLIEKNWMQKIVTQLERGGVQASISADRNILKTQRTQIRLLNEEKIQIFSDCEEQLRIIDQAFEKVSKIIMLQ